MKKIIKKIGVLTSGGDAPGMNAAIRAVVRTAIFYKLEVVGIMRGYQGLIEGDVVPMESKSVSKIINLGGTILHTSRCPEFKDKEVRRKAIDGLKEAGIDALVVIGGDGSFRGANDIFNDFDYPVVGIPATIDNDIYGTDFTIGFDTAINTAMDAIDKIRDTAHSHDMVFFVEVMGRDAGFIALHTGIATGSEVTLIPEIQKDMDSLVDYLKIGRRKNKTSGIVVVAEGGHLGSAAEVARQVKERIPSYEVRVTTLGHIQRGGSPSCSDRVLASIYGYESVCALLDGQSGVMIGRVNGKTVYTPFDDAISKHGAIDRSWYEITKILSV
ncbi:MAG: 6-phosphofructokinase [Bacteroidales bacterium]|nr:6-phosphofructokinase [Bacteroidales bacterium]